MSRCRPRSRRGPLPWWSQSNLTRCTLVRHGLEKLARPETKRCGYQVPRQGLYLRVVAEPREVVELPGVAESVLGVRQPRLQVYERLAGLEVGIGLSVGDQRS